MIPEEINKCIQIGHQEDPKGNPILQEYLFTNGKQAFTIEVVGIPLHPSLAEDINKEKIPPLAVPAGMLRNPDEVCDFILSAPFSSIRNHLVAQDNLPPETEG